MDKTLEKIYGSGLRLLPTLSLPDTCRLIVEEGIQLAKANYGSILLLENKELKRVYASPAIFPKIKPRKGDFMYRVLKTRQPAILTVKQIARYHPEILATKIRSDIIFPLSNHQQTFGIISFMSLQDKHFTKKEVDSLKMFIPIAMLAIRKAQLNDESRKALESRDRFISIAAHEFRNPLTTINGYAQLLYSKFSESNTPESRWVEELSWESHRLTQLTNELLEIDRIKSGKLRYTWEECYLKEIIDRALLDFRFTRPQNKVILKNKLTPGQDRIIGDFNKLLQVVINLLDNAAKFSPPDKEIFLTLKRKSDQIIFQIKDQGKGISKKDLPRVCQIFYRGNNNCHEGMGVGLFLTKSIVTQHRGIINIKSKKAKGTTVEIKLPELKI